MPSCLSCHIRPGDRETSGRPEPRRRPVTGHLWDSSDAGNPAEFSRLRTIFALWLAPDLLRLPKRGLSFGMFGVSARGTDASSHANYSRASVSLKSYLSNWATFSIMVASERKWASLLDS
jgi:hypothetical protein